MPSHKQKVERAIWKLTRPFLDLPPRDKSKDGMAEYMKARRQVEKIAHNPVVLRELGETYATVVDFLKDYNLNIKDIETFLGMDLKEFIPKQKRKKR